jgi:hypothetical protein
MKEKNRGPIANALSKGLDEKLAGQFLCSARLAILFLLENFEEGPSLEDQRQEALEALETVNS